MPNWQFGSGVLFATPNGGNQGANPTPMQFGTLQEVSLDISGDVKELYGQNQVPDVIARGKYKITGKAKFAKLHGKQMNDLFFGMTTAVGQVLAALDEIHTVPSTPFQFTIAPPNSGVFVENLGVRYVSTGDPLTQVAAAPAVGQYTQVAGLYTFNTGDQGTNNVMVSYRYSVATGLHTPVTAQLMGFAPVFSCVLRELFTSGGVAQQSNVKLYSCIGSKITRATKNEDFMVPEFDFSVFANAAGQVMDFDDPY